VFNLILLELDFTKTSFLAAREVRLHIWHPRFQGKKFLNNKKNSKLGNKNGSYFNIICIYRVFSFILGVSLNMVIGT
jgi:hypothetical protein